MFKCAISGKMSKPGEKVNRIVLETRIKEYMGERYDEDTDQYNLVVVGRGYETVKEVFATKEGYELWQKTQTALQSE